jgi:hypothetical protein
MNLSRVCGGCFCAVQGSGHVPSFALRMPQRRPAQVPRAGSHPGAAAEEDSLVLKAEQSIAVEDLSVRCGGYTTWYIMVVDVDSLAMPYKRLL